MSQLFCSLLQKMSNVSAILLTFAKKWVLPTPIRTNSRIPYFTVFLKPPKNGGCIGCFGHFCILSYGMASKNGGCIGCFAHFRNCTNYDMQFNILRHVQKMSNVLAVLLTFEMYLAILAFYLMAWLQKMGDALAVLPTFEI